MRCPRLGPCALSLLACLLTPRAGTAQRVFPLTEWRSYLTATTPLGGDWSAIAHLTDYGNVQRRDLDELKVGVSGEYAHGPWQLSTGYEHDVVRTATSRTPEERFLFEANFEHRITKWLSASDHEKVEVRDLPTQWATRWINHLRADLGGSTMPLVTPWVARDWSFDARYHEFNKTGWWYGLRVRSRMPVGLEVFFYDENDLVRTPRRLTAMGLTLNLRS
ncbi:MAG TPA: hypothetical protein VIJ16_08005 [Gemmatimonadaceae bacterium]